MNPWLLIYENRPGTAAYNMAVDEFLFLNCRPNRDSFLRLYSWDKPTFSIGASQKIERALDVSEVLARGCAYVRRPTGGKTVLHDREITYAVATAAPHFINESDLFHSYRDLSMILSSALAAVGVQATLAGSAAAAQVRSNLPCFSFPTSHELEVDGKKIIGSAQKRDQFALLQHGSLPLTMDFGLYAAGTAFNAEDIRSAMLTLSEVSSCSRREMEQALIDAFASFSGAPLEKYEFSSADHEKINELEKKYLSADWNHLR